MDDRKSTISSLKSRSHPKSVAKSRLAKKRAGTFLSVQENWKFFSIIVFGIVFVLGWKPLADMLDVFEKNIALRGYTLSKQIGFQVNDLIVEGRSLTPQKDILKAVNIRRGDSLFASDLADMKMRLEALSWVRTATIQRRWPFTIYVRLAEYKPIALWQQKTKFYLVDDQGHHFNIPKNNPFQSLPILTGEEAPKNAPHLFSVLRDFPRLIGRVTGAIYLGKRRWDLMLDNRLKLKLGEERIKQGLVQFIQLEEGRKISDKNIVAIDLRFEDKIYFQLAPEAAEVKLSSKQT
ncbi:MAG: cell division protein FtsQ/DivIB [Candidatus Paracaedimonas acanthamoebae]|uniref:Cell division protein FtsQ n=1 Tax=Candidatus Paracaedimonas acanthamoebae TaxID=244581 RepID=A0A8J7PT68_9PROT|nr:cell division protein FtsQ/DivIB [Candidatus Paracaedimonas acanthamoebae]